MTVFDHSCLVSTIKNISGGTMKFGFIPPHGKELEDEEEISVFGDIREAVNRGDRFGARNSQALLDALDAGLVEITSTPAPIFWDETDEQTVVLGVDNGAVTYSDPCWEESV